MNNNLNKILHQVVNLVGQNKYYDAGLLLKKAKHISPRNPDVYHLLGVVLNRTGRRKDAIKLVKKAIKFAPKIGMYHRTLAVMLNDDGRKYDAIKEFRVAISLSPSDMESHISLGVIYSEKGDFEKSINEYKYVIRKDPTNYVAYTNIGNDLVLKNDIDRAIVAYNKAISINDYVQAHFGLANAMEVSGLLNEAIREYKYVLDRDPSNINAYINMGLAYKEDGKISESIKSYNNALNIDDSNAGIYNNLGNSYSELDEHDIAISMYKKAINLDVTFKEAYVGLGNALKSSGDGDGAVNAYMESLNIDGNYANAHWNLSLLLLQIGKYDVAWDHYEWGRLYKKSRRKLDLPAPLWEGQSLIGKTILVTAEQGVGDEILFSVCINDVISLNPIKVFIECDCRLSPLFERSFESISTIDRSENTDKLIELSYDVDYVISSGSLPRFFRKRLDQFPKHKSFLSAEDGLREKWKMRYDSIGDGIKIGISWTGGAKHSRKSRNRSTSLSQWSFIVSLNAYFINLQYGNHEREIRDLESEAGIRIYDWSDVDPLSNLDNQAAQIAELDLIISFDNATVQLAGALGKDVWVLAPYPPFWTWMGSGNDSPWYQSVKLYRQSEKGGWEDVMMKVYDDLKLYIKKNQE